LKKIIKYFLITLPKKYISRLGFVNYYIPYVNGPKERLILSGEYKDVDLGNTIFNTMSGDITIEKNCFFSHNCMLLTGKHNYFECDSDVFRNDVFQERNIYIEEGTWLASGCIILGNVHIGKNCVISAGSVVTKDMPAYSLVAGIPARVVKSLK